MRLKAESKRSKRAADSYRQTGASGDNFTQMPLHNSRTLRTHGGITRCTSVRSTMKGKPTLFLGVCANLCKCWQCDCLHCRYASDLSATCCELRAGLRIAIVGRTLVIAIVVKVFAVAHSGIAHAEIVGSGLVHLARCHLALGFETFLRRHARFC